MRTMLLGGLMVLMVTAALATESVNTANFMLPYCKLSGEEASANTTNAMIWGRCSGIIHGLIEMFGLLQEEEGNYSPLFHPVQAVAHAKRIVRAVRMAARGFKPLRRPVATTEQRSA